MAKSKFKTLPGSRLELEVTIEDKEFKGYWEDAFSEATKKVQIKGFRPGAAPKEMLAGGVDNEKVFNEALHEAVRLTLDEIKHEHDWTFIEPPQVEVLDAKDSVRYKAILTIFPDIILGDYKKIAKRILGGRKAITLDEKEVAKALEWLRNSRAEVTKVDRPAQLRDLVECDIITTNKGKALANAQFKGERFVLGESRFLVGFDQELQNHRSGATLTFSLKAPANYWEKSLRGEQLDFKVALHAVFDRKLPELNDEFAKMLGQSFTTMDEVKKSITEGLRQEQEEKETERLRVKLLDEMIKDSKIDLPEIMVSRTLDGMVKDMEKMLPPTDNTNPEALKKEMREKLESRARQNVASNLVLYKLSRAEQLEPTKEELEVEAKRARVDLNEHYDYIYGTLQNQKVFAFLENQVKI